MSGKRNIGGMAAIGGMTAAVMLLTGLPAAKADELADLRANQQLLQQRIDQLAQAQAAMGAPEQQAAVLGGPVVAGAPSLAGSFPRSFLIPGTNTSIAISGYVKFDAAEWLHGGSPDAGSEVTPSVTGIPVVASLPLNLKGTGVFAAPTFNPAARSNGVFHDSAAESRFRIETRTPTPYGTAGTVLEVDFYGCSVGGPNCVDMSDGTFRQLAGLRLAYGTLGGFLAGQDFIPVNDLEAGPTLFDFGGDAGTFSFARAPWLGYTWQLPYGLSFLAAAVTPSTSFYSPAGALEVDSAGTGLAGTASPPTTLAVNPNKTTMPDADFVLKSEQPWGEAQIHAVAQRLTLQDGAFVNQNFLGYGGGVSMHVIPDWFGWSRDNFGMQVFGGPGLGHYFNPAGTSEPFTADALATNYGAVGVGCVFNPITGVGPGCYGNSAGGGNTAANAALVRTQTIMEYGAEGNYQHWWTPHLRSTVSAGFQTAEIPVSIVGVNTNSLQYNKTLITAHLNLMWSPVSFINTGFEFIYGHRLTILGATASEDVIDYAFQVKF